LAWAVPAPGVVNIEFCVHWQFTGTMHAPRMFRVLGCVFEQHDLRLVVLAGVLCLFACVTAMSMLARARLATGGARVLWLVAAGTVAGCGIWGTHFIAMLAYVSGFPVAYDPNLTAASVVIAIALCSLGFTIALSGLGATLGGGVAGAAIGAMHYVGMAAVRAPAHAIWDPWYVVSSVVIGVVLMASGMRFAVSRDHWRWHFASGLIFTVSICSMHFTAMTAVVYKFDPRVVVPNAVMVPTSLAIAVAAVAVMVVALGLVGALIDNHLAQRASGEAERLRAHVLQLEHTKLELERTSQDLVGALAAADAANKSKSQFLASMSHELRTPLNAVIGFSEVLSLQMFGPLGDARYRAYARDIRNSGEHLLSLINDILDLSRLDAGQGSLHEEALDLGKLLEDAMRMVEPQAAKASLKLSKAFARDLPRVCVDERRIKQVVINIVSNSVKFTPAGGTVSVTADASPAGIAICIRDTGIGMAKADIPRAFERFGQVDSTLARKYEGAGLGLPLARELVELHGGTLALESAPGLGTAVTITLPSRCIVAESSAAVA
jgi:signal transduction histidine kinase